MDHLRSLFAGLGFANVETFIASGNVIFDSKAKDTSALERKIEKHLLVILGYEVRTFVRSVAEVAAGAHKKVEQRRKRGVAKAQGRRSVLQARGRL